MFQRILIANRGEIACRVARTARRLGIVTVAVYSDADADARHVELADEAVRLGPAPAAQSYLRGDALIAAAQRTGCEALHPGYGFLSENADFADACRDGGVVFIGPPPSAIRTMGSKDAAKACMQAAGVTTVPGYHGEEQDADALAGHAERIGFPVLIKAAAGGGGKGMRRVEAPGEFVAALASARREARAAFGDDTVILERCLEDPRHIEVQVFADRHGNVVHLFERDCSIQRRHQKILEEAPAPGVGAEWRRAIGTAAVDAAAAIGYVGAGTVEFLAEGDTFYFMEMNTRLQVEHPVTELVTGIDLVEWQIRVAAGEPLPCRQDELAMRGHAIEARIYAEDPRRDFLPVAGAVRRLRFPPESAHVRVDTGVREGDAVGVHYDPLIAKLVVWDGERPAALRRLRRALAATEIVGLPNNVEFLKRVAHHPAYAAGEYDTRFVERHADALLAAPAGSPPDTVLALTCLFLHLHRERPGDASRSNATDPYSPWQTNDGWCLNEDSTHVVHLRHDAGEVEALLRYSRKGLSVELPRASLAVSGRLDAQGDLLARVGESTLRASVVVHGAAVTVFLGGERHELSCVGQDADDAEAPAALGVVSAPMPGRIVDVRVAANAEVHGGDVLVVMEAMKMEHAIRAPAHGVVAVVRCRQGDLVAEGAELLRLEANA